VQGAASHSAVLADEIAGLLAQEKSSAVRRRMEFGPARAWRALDPGDARSPRMQSVMNQKIKYRNHSGRCARVLREHVHEWFEFHGDSPYMLLVADVQPAHRLADATRRESLSGLDQMQVPRSTVPAVTHIDYSARVQTVRREAHPTFYAIIEAFHRRTGCRRRQHVVQRRASRSSARRRRLPLFHAD